MKIRIAGIIEESFVDGEGVRFAIFVQGCPHKCKGCHNPETHNFGGGKILNTEKIISDFAKSPLIIGITLTGGEPLCQIDAVTELAKAAKNFGLNVWCYTGFTYEDLFSNDKIKHFLNYVDVLVDGKFIESQRDLNLSFRGSTNQRLIDVTESLSKNKIILRRR